MNADIYVKIHMNTYIHICVYLIIYAHRLPMTYLCIVWCQKAKLPCGVLSKPIPTAIDFGAQIRLQGSSYFFQINIDIQMHLFPLSILSQF